MNLRNNFIRQKMFKEEFVKSVEEAERESGKIFKDREELREYLESLTEEEDV